MRPEMFCERGFYRLPIVVVHFQFCSFKAIFLIEPKDETLRERRGEKVALAKIS